MSVGLCETCRVWLERAIKDRLEKQPFDGPYVFKRSNDRVGTISETFTSRETRAILGESGSCWICSMIWRSISGGVTGAHHYPQHLPDKLDLGISFQFWSDRQEKSGNERVSIWPPRDQLESGYGTCACLLQLEEPEQDFLTEAGLRDLRSFIYEFKEIIDGGPSAGSKSLVAVRNTFEDDYLTKLKTANENAAPGAPNQERLQVIKNWLSDCDSSHHCGSQATNGTVSGFAPPRLLHLGPGAHRVNLVDTASPEEFVKGSRYATLSYCWGHEKPLRLTTDETYQKFRDGMPTEKLGRMFSEAIYLLQELGIGFVWIDCFCIIQDSSGDADWLNHTPMMHSIYGSSYINIAASASRSWTESLWSEPKDVQFRHLEVLLPGGKRLHSQSHSREFLCSSEFLATNYRRSPIFRRGWCLQEFFFSPRTIHMVESQMFWECRELMTSEISTLLIIDPGQQNLGRVSLDLGSLDATWLRLADSFAETKVTFSRDRLYALASTADWFRQAYEKIGVETRYLAGHWEHNLRESILWSGSIESKQFSDLSLPSWSWLRARQVTFETSWRVNFSDDFGMLDKFLVDVESTNIELQESGQPFGLVKTSSIHLRGSLFQLVYEGSSDNKTNGRSDGNGHGQFYLSTDHSLVDTHDRTAFRFPEWNPDRAKAIRCLTDERYSDLDAEPMSPLEDYILLPVAYSNARNGICQLIYTVALAPCVGHATGAEQTYKHCGSVHISLQKPMWDGFTVDLADAMEEINQAEAGVDSDLGPGTMNEQASYKFESSHRALADLCEFIKQRPKRSIVLV